MFGCALAESPGGLDPTPQIVHAPSLDVASKSLANDAVPLEVSRKLGAISSGLIAYFSMDNRETGGLTWSIKPIAVRASKEVQAREGDGRKYLDFSEGGAVLLFSPAWELPRHYTLAAWVQAPAPQKHGVIWHGSGMLLDVEGQALAYWMGGKGGKYAEFATPLNGWYHVAVEFDGQKTQAFLNGKPLDPVKGNVSKDLQAIGNHPSSEHRGWMMASGIDEMYIFNRVLPADEIISVARVGKP